MIHPVKTDLYTLKRVWTILKEMNLEGLLSGGNLDINVTSLLNALLVEDKLNLLCQVITNTEDDFEKHEISQILELFKAFFTNIAEPFVSMSGTALLQAKRKK